MFSIRTQNTEYCCCLTLCVLKTIKQKTDLTLWNYDVASGVKEKTSVVLSWKPIANSNKLILTEARWILQSLRIWRHINDFLIKIPRSI
jgi:hypothetical protein